MKRLILLMAIYVAAATGLSLQAENTKSDQPSHTQDTITIKLPNGAGMKVYVKNNDQLKALKSYKLDSLMALLAKYVDQVEVMEKANNGTETKEVTMTFYPAKDLKDADAPEQVSITISSNSVKKLSSQGKNEKIENLVNIIVEMSNDKETRDSLKVVKNKTKANKSTKFAFDIDLGVNAFAKYPGGTTDRYDLKPLGSRYVSLNQHFQARIGGQKSPFHLVTGFEVAFNNYMLDKNNYVADIDGRTEFLKMPSTERSFEKSKLTTSSFNVPLMAMLKFKDRNGKKTFKIGAGGFAGYRLGSHTKLKYQEEGRTYKDKERGSYNLEDLQYGVNFVIGFRDLELFGKYNLNDLFKDNRGPAINVVSFGFRI